jgi:23S rRNA pseudouridine1911/1915/1917 synthase
MDKGNKTQILKIAKELSGIRADVVLSELISGHTRSQIKKLIDDNWIILQDRSLKPSTKLEEGDVVQITLPEPEPLDLAPEDLSVELLYEDECIAVIDKPAGMTVHPGAGVKSGTLVNALLFQCKDLSGIGGKIRPGIVHRLDKDTSGVMVVAKNDQAHNSLVEQFKTREVKKRYIAIVEGNVKGDSGVFESEIGRHPTNRIKMSSRAKAGRESVTKWKTLERYGPATLVEAEPRTGRTHQIRVHFSESGYPVLADKVYGPKKNRNEVLKSASKLMGRQALHAWELGFKHPLTDEFLQFKAPLPRDMEKTLKYLKQLEG